MAQELQAVLLTANEIQTLSSLLSRESDRLVEVQVALRNPIPDLAGFQSDLAEVISRARDASSYINEDFPELLETLKTLRPAYKAALAARTEPAKA